MSVSDIICRRTRIRREREGGDIVDVGNGITTGELILYLLPVIIIQLALMVYALVDVARRERVRYGSKLLWVVVIVLINIIGPIVYLAWGRMPAEDRMEDYGP